MHTVIPLIIANSALHLRWLNTLSYLENCGARKIAALEHPTLVKEQMLKHAAEEFRHAYILKKQMTRLGSSFPTYEQKFLLGGWHTIHYLDRLECVISRFLKAHRTPSVLAYLLITYAIEKRADYLYPLYETYLRQTQHPVTVKSILLEEQGHLREMEEALQEHQQGTNFTKIVCQFEQAIYQEWFSHVQKSIHSAI